MIKWLRAFPLPVQKGVLALVVSGALSGIAVFAGCSDGAGGGGAPGGDAGDGGGDGGVNTPPPGPLSGPVNVWQVMDPPPLADHVKALAAAFSLDTGNMKVIEQAPDSIDITDKVSDLVVYPSGTFEYSRYFDDDSTGNPAAPAPTRDQAIAMASAFLRAADTQLQGLHNSAYNGYALTPDHAVFVVTGAGVDNAVDPSGDDAGPEDAASETLVMIKPALQLSSSPDLQLLVENGEIMVTIEQGQVTKVKSKWRPMKLSGPVPARTVDRLQTWLTSLQGEVGSTVNDLLPEYFIPDDTARVTFLAPVYAVPYVTGNGGADGGPGVAPVSAVPVPNVTPHAQQRVTASGAAPILNSRHGTIGSPVDGTAVYPQRMPATSWNIELGVVNDGDDQPSGFHVGFMIAGGNMGVGDADLKYDVAISSDIQGLVYRTQLIGSRAHASCAPSAAAPVDAGALGDAAALPPGCMGGNAGSGAAIGIELVDGEVAPIFFDSYLPLANGLHNLQISILDHNKNLVQGVYSAMIQKSTIAGVQTNDSVFAGPPKPWPKPATRRDGPVMVDVIPGQTLYPPRAAPIFKKLRRRPWEKMFGSAVDTIELEQWRYHLQFELEAAKTYLIYDSTKCVSGPLGLAADKVKGTAAKIQCGACERPNEVTDANNAIVKFAIPSNMSDTLQLQEFTTPTELGGATATNQTLSEFQSSVSFDNLPGKLDMRFKFQTGLTMCAPDYPGIIGFGLREVLLLGGGAVRPLPTGLGRCESVIPEVDWRYSFDPKGTTCSLLQKMCAIPAGEKTGACRIERKGAKARPGFHFGDADSQSLPVPATQADIDALCPDPNKAMYVVRADVDTYMRYEFGGSRMNPSFIRDTRAYAVPSFDYNWGQQLIPDSNSDPMFRDKITRFVLTKVVGNIPSAVPLGAEMQQAKDLFTFIPPMPFETIADFRNADVLTPPEPNRQEDQTTARRFYDNIHIKQVRDVAQTLINVNQSYDPTFVHYGYAAFPGGNTSLSWDDQAPCFHLHERWNSVSANVGVHYYDHGGNVDLSLQNFGPGYNSPDLDIRYISVLDKVGERNPMVLPESLVDDDTGNPGALTPVDWTNPKASVTKPYVFWKIGSPLATDHLLNTVDPQAQNIHPSHGGERIGPKLPFKEVSGKKIALWGRQEGGVALRNNSTGAYYPLTADWDDFTNTDYRTKKPASQLQAVAGELDWVKTNLAPVWVSPDIMQKLFRRNHEIITK